MATLRRDSAGKAMPLNVLLVVWMAIGRGVLAPLGYGAFVGYVTVTAPRTLTPEARRWLPAVLADDARLGQLFRTALDQRAHGGALYGLCHAAARAFRFSSVRR